MENCSRNLNSTLPNISAPIIGESLYGYLLRLDYLNHFSPGSVMKMIKKHTTGVPSLNRPGLFLTGNIFDLYELSIIVDISIDELIRLTLIPCLKNVFRTEYINPHLAGYSKNFKLCPKCVKENFFPLVQTFINVDSCVTHKIKLIEKCICGNTIFLFDGNTKIYSCPFCNIQYENSPIIDITDENAYRKQLFFYDSYCGLISGKYKFIRDNEDLKTGFEGRLQYLSYEFGIEKGKFKHIYGYDVDNMKNGHGPINLSLAKLLNVFYDLDVSINAFCDIKIPDKYFKMQSLNNVPIIESTCPNIFCINYALPNNSNIKNYGKKKTASGVYLLEQYCTTCGTRFFGNNIIQSYDYNPGMRYVEIEKSKYKIETWKQKLSIICEDLIKNMVPITLTGTFKKAGIPIGKTYFIQRLGLVEIIEKYANLQKKFLADRINEIGINEYNHLLNRIYRPKKRKLTK